jgi:hypothetical protein
MSDEQLQWMPNLMGDGILPSMLAWQSACTAMALQAQQEQLKLLSSWQGMASNFQRELWDSWIARFGGGVPLDA